MDEGTLNDLLECSVCLERLDTSSKVLPCQHTFCRKCLEEIVQKHKELRCPECRILVNLKVDELPPNVLLMRILEGMRNAAPKKQQRIRGANNQPSPLSSSNNPIQVQVQNVQGTPERLINKQNSTSHLIPHQPYAKALYDYGSKEAGDLNFKRGDIIILRKRIDTHWYQGECSGNQGVFPLSYVQIITPLPSHVPQCKALYDFRMNNDEEEGCLAFSKGDIINVIRRVDENWAEGKLDGRIGIFPLAFVELNNLARSLMKLSTNVQPGPSKVAPPTPTTDDSTPLIPTDHSKNVVSQQHIQGLVTSDSSTTVSSGSSSTTTTTTPNISSSSTSSSSSTAPSSPATPPPRNQPLPPRSMPQKPDLLQNSSACSTPQRYPNSVQDARNSHNKEKRHSFTSSLTPQHHGKSTHRHSAEILSDDSQNRATRSFPTAASSAAATAASGAAAITAPLASSIGTNNDIPLPAAYIALYPYKPQKCDELELRKGGVYMVTERCQDGWYKGTSNRTQKTGVFPGNYVILARSVNGNSCGSSREQSTTTGIDKVAVSFTRNGKSVSSSAVTTTQRQVSCLPPELPPRSISPATATNNTISSSWHGQQDNASVPLGRSSSAIISTNVQKPTDKNKDRKEKGTVSLMRRLTSIKRSKSPPASSYSMDNPVFEDSVNNPATSHPVHVRSGSCPSQLLQIQPNEHHRLFGTTSQRLKQHKERPSVLTHNSRSTETTASGGGTSNSSPDVHHHRKSNSLDAGRSSTTTTTTNSSNTTTVKTGVQTVRERFRCIAPYPPNSEYELELQVNDIIYVHKKRDDGWYKGTQQRTGRTGLFPASFVEGF